MSQTFSSIHEERSVWLTLSGLWAFSGLIAWLTSVAGTWAALNGETLTACAILIAGVGVALRLPILTEACERDIRPPNDLVDHAVLLLGYLANFNWLGHLLLRSSSVFDAVPAMLCLLGCEIWVHRRFFSAKCLGWFKFACRSGKHRTVAALGRLNATKDLEPTRTTTHASLAPAPRNATPQPNTGQIEPPSLEADLSSTAADGLPDSESRPPTRQTTDGVDDQGRRFLGGEILLTFAPQQSTQEIAIGFCPAFDGTPEVDFESSDPEVELRLLACSPQGMRLTARRIRQDSPAEATIEWYASQMDPDAQPAQPMRTLP